MFFLGINILIILSAIVGGLINKIFNKKFSYWNLQNAFWFGLLLPDTTNYTIYPIALIVGYLSCRYMPILAEYVARKILARYNKKRWAKYIHKKN